MNGFREKGEIRTNERTDGQTDATPKVSMTSWSRDQKPPFLGIWAKSPILEVFGQNGENYQKNTWNIFPMLTSPN